MFGILQDGFNKGLNILPSGDGRLVVSGTEKDYLRNTKKEIKSETYTTVTFS